MATLPHADWHYPTAIRFGNGRVEELPSLCQSLGIHNPLLVTDEGLAGAEFVMGIQQTITPSALFCEVKSNPTGCNVTAGVAAYRAGDHDGVIALGGGSGLDAGKAIALMVGQRRPIWDFEDVGDNWQRVDAAGIAPLVAIPTTAGTGSEVGRAAVIVDEGSRSKKIIFHPRMMPDSVILDPELTRGLPPHLTAATGLDAFVHNFEAYCAPGYHPMADGIALQAMTLIKQWLPIAYADGNCLEARGQMLAASSMGAIAFQKGLGAVHALAHPLGALYDQHHGLLNAVLLPYVLRANRAAIETKIDRLCVHLDLERGFDCFFAWIMALRQRLGISHTLEELGIDTSRAREIGERAVADPSAASNPVAFSAEAYQQLFVQAVRGAAT